jgi:uncharacterized protein (DUF1810 family)
MWFVFPQLAGLGHSAMAQRFAVSSRLEAIAYLEHQVLGSRLRECTALVNAVEGRTIQDILGSPDDLKFRSSMTLFCAVSRDSVFLDAIANFMAADRIRQRWTCWLLGRERKAAPGLRTWNVLPANRTKANFQAWRPAGPTAGVTSLSA